MAASIQRSASAEKPIHLPRRGKETFALVSACFGPLSYGFVLGYSSPVIQELKRNKIITDDEASWFGSLVAIGAIVGGPLGGCLIQVCGRKLTVAISAVPFLLGWFLTILNVNSVAMLYSGRLLSGLATGLVSISVPVYIAEMCSKSRRGLFGSLYRTSVALGTLVAYVLGMVLDMHWLGIAGAVFPTILLMSILFMPQTPRYLLSKTRKREATSTLEWLRGSEEDIEDECTEIEAVVFSKQAIDCEEFAKPSLFKPLILSTVLMLFQQFSGVNAVIFYSESIFKSAGFPLNAQIPEMVIGVVQVLGTLVASFLMDRAGRKKMLIISGVGMSVSSIGLGVYYYLIVARCEGMNIHWLSLVFLVLFMIFYSLGWGPIPFLSMSELLPLRARGFGSALAVIVVWLSVFVVTKEFTDIENAIHPYGAFWMFGGFCLLGTVVVGRFLPETKGKSLEQIELYFEGLADLRSAN